MNKYMIPKMDIAYFAKENIVITDSVSNPNEAPTGIAAFAKSDTVTLKSVKINDVMSWNSPVDLTN